MTTEIINRGKHRAIARHLQFGHAGSDDKEQVVIGFELTNEQDPDFGRFITAFLFFTDGTFDRTIESLRYLGWQGDDLSELPALLDAGGLANEVDLVVDHEEYQGAWQAKVKWINRVGGGAITLKKPLEGDELSTFAARMKGRIRAADGAPRNATPKPRPQSGVGNRTDPHPNAPGSDRDGGGWSDDIPF